MVKCQICNDKLFEADWAWQPFGPGDVDTFAFVGSHYRGFPVIKVCDVCKGKIQDKAEPVLFRYKGDGYICRAKVVEDAPSSGRHLEAD